MSALAIALVLISALFHKPHRGFTTNQHRFCRAHGKSLSPRKTSGDSPDRFLNHIYGRILDFASQINTFRQCLNMNVDNFLFFRYNSEQFSIISALVWSSKMQLANGSPH